VGSFFAINVLFAITPDRENQTAAVLAAFFKKTRIKKHKQKMGTRPIP
jgi:hypothetical protein